MEPGDGENYIQAFPSGKGELSSFDVVFIGDIGIGSNELTEKQASLLKGLVEQQGSGLIFLPGRRGRQMSLLSSELSELIPVVLDEAKPKGHSFVIDSALNLTARGRDHLLTMLASTPSGNYAVWNNLPGTYWYAPVVRAKTGSTVLAIHANARNEYGRLPLLVTQDHGNGKVLFMGTDGAWRWRRGVEDTYHYRFWGQVVRWMAHQRHLAHGEGIRFFFNPETPVKGRRVFLHATVFDRSGYPLIAGNVKAVITAAESSCACSFGVG